MTNFFMRRATELIRDDSAFLAIVSPAPLTTFFAPHHRKSSIFDMPVRVIGTPGSGKTMMASLAEFRLVEAVLRDQSSQSARDLAGALAACGLINGKRPAVAAVRIPMEAEYRDFWELPYPDAVKTRLALSLVQARALLGLIRNLTASKRRSIADIRFITRDTSEAHIEHIGGADSEAIRRRALDVQKAIYGVVAGLVPPPIKELPALAKEPYQPLEAIGEIEIDWDGAPIRMRPLIILDDVHTLHPVQLQQIFTSLARREVKVGRWLMMRLDALSPRTIFQSATNSEAANLKADREYLNIFMQSQTQRREERNQFRRMATDMADRYLEHVSTLRERNFRQFGTLVPSTPPRITEAKLRELATAVDKVQRKQKIADSRRTKIDGLVATYLSRTKSPDTAPEVALAMSRILLHRYVNRIEGKSPGLFEEFDPDPKVSLKADQGVADGARIQLAADYGRAFHYGLDDLCDASNENAELFLQLAGVLVERMETRAIRNLDPALSPEEQQEALRAKANEILAGWAFPYVRRARALMEAIATASLEMSLKPNARLGYGANAVGIPMDDFNDIIEQDDDLTQVLKYATGYGVLHVVPNYGQGGKDWCLIEVAGPGCLVHGLTLKRGGFLEWRADRLREIIS